MPTSSTHAPAPPTWRKSSYSGSGNDTCVEVASLAGIIAIRDSKDPEGPTISLTPRAFHRLLADLAAGPGSVESADHKYRCGSQNHQIDSPAPLPCLPPNPAAGRRAAVSQRRRRTGGLGSSAAISANPSNTLGSKVPLTASASATVSRAPLGIEW